MKLSEYFNKTRGRGVLATSDSSGAVDAAVYARPHFLAEDTVAFVMGERLSHRNLKSNPHAAYIFMEEGKEDTGKRLYLTKIGEERNDELVEKLRKEHRYTPHEGYYNVAKYVVTFKVDKTLPLVEQ
jgi:hypothetical protein